MPDLDLYVLKPSFFHFSFYIIKKVNSYLFKKKNIKYYKTFKRIVFLPFALLFIFYIFPL